MKTTGVITWIVRRYFGRSIEGFFVAIDGYKTLISTLLSFFIACYWAYNGQDPQTTNEYFQTVLKLMLDYGHEPLLTTAQTAQVVFAADKAAKWIKVMYQIIRAALRRKGLWPK